MLDLSKCSKSRERETERQRVKSGEILVIDLGATAWVSKAFAILVEILITKEDVKEFIIDKLPLNSKILDIGPGIGTYSQLQLVKVN